MRRLWSSLCSLRMRWFSCWWSWGRRRARPLVSSALLSVWEVGILPTSSSLLAIHTCLHPWSRYFSNLLGTSYTTARHRLFCFLSPCKFENLTTGIYYSALHRIGCTYLCPFIPGSFFLSLCALHPGCLWKRRLGLWEGGINRLGLYRFWIIGWVGVFVTQLEERERENENRKQEVNFLKYISS